MIHCLFRFKVPRESFLLVLLFVLGCGLSATPRKSGNHLYCSLRSVEYDGWIKSGLRQNG